MSAREDATIKINSKPIVFRKRNLINDHFWGEKVAPAIERRVMSPELMGPTFLERFKFVRIKSRIAILMRWYQFWERRRSHRDIKKWLVEIRLTISANFVKDVLLRLIKIHDIRFNLKKVICRRLFEVWRSKEVIVKMLNLWSWSAVWDLKV